MARWRWAWILKERDGAALKTKPVWRGSATASPAIIAVISSWAEEDSCWAMGLSPTKQRKFWSLITLRMSCAGYRRRSTSSTSPIQATTTTAVPLLFPGCGCTSIFKQRALYVFCHFREHFSAFVSCCFTSWPIDFCDLCVGYGCAPVHTRRI